MTTFDAPPLPSVSQLVRAIGIAAVVATVVLVTAVLPAEYGIDPTGIGQAIGLLRPPASAVDMAIPVTAEAAALVTKYDATFRSDEMTLMLKPGSASGLSSWRLPGVGLE